MQSMRSLGIFIVSAAVVMFAVDGWLVSNTKYWGLSWQPDKFLHFTGGALVALFAGYMLFTAVSLAPARTLPRFALFVVLVAVAGLGGLFWEFYEYAWDTFVAIPLHTFLAQPSVNDTMGDLLADIAGAIAASVAFILFIKRARFL